MQQRRFSRPRARLARAGLSLAAAAALWLAPAAGRAACTGETSAPPLVTPEGVSLRISESTAGIGASQAWEQTNCFVLDYTGASQAGIVAKIHFEEDEDLGPWSVTFPDDRSVPGGVTLAACTTGGPGELTMIPSVALQPGEYTDECCATWTVVAAACLDLPLPPDDLVGELEVEGVPHTLGAQLREPILSGSACGLIGIEPLLLLAPLVARRRRRVR